MKKKKKEMAKFESIGRASVSEPSLSRVSLFKYQSNNHPGFRALKYLTTVVFWIKCVVSVTCVGSIEMDFSEQKKMDDDDCERFRDVSTSSGEDLPFSDLEKSLNALLLEDCADIKRKKTLRDFFVEEKANYFLQVSSSLEETKANFVAFCASVEKDIEDMIRRLVGCIQARKQELKSQLEAIKMEKVTKWDRQLYLCRKALRDLQSPVDYSPDFRYDVGFEPALEFIDAGDARFETDNYSKILKNLKTLGKITCGGLRSDLTNIKPKIVFGGSGGGPGEFCRPWGTCSDATGRILVCDRSNHRIQVFSESGEFLMAFGGEGSRSGEFNRPSGVDVDEKCRIVVADKDNHRIQVFTYCGAFIYKFGSLGKKPGEFEYPWDVSVNKNCDIAVSDSKNHRIQLFDERGRFITLLDAAKLGMCNPRTGLKLLDSPRGLAFRPDGSLLATDFNNHRVLLISKNFDEISSFGSEGVNLKEFFRPQGIACDRNGRIAVADSKNYRIQVFDRFGNVIECFGSQGDKPGQFDCPLGISFHPNQNIVVVDFHNNRVQVF